MNSTDMLNTDDRNEGSGHNGGMFRMEAPVALARIQW
jgi:hypothetical protein